MGYLYKGSSKWMEDQGFIPDHTSNGYPRYTHKLSGSAVVRQPYMSDMAWHTAKLAFVRSMKAWEPKEDADYERALEQAGYVVANTGWGSFEMRCRTGGGATALESNEYSSALAEAWALVKP